MSKRGDRRRESKARRDTRRRVEQLAKNPLCESNVLSVLHDVPMNEVAQSLGLPSKFGQSRFAITRGLAFERSLYREGAARLLQALVKAAVLPSDAEGFLDLRLTLGGGPVKTLDRAHERTVKLLERLATEGAFPGMPAVVAGPALTVPGKALLPDGMVALDVMTVHVVSDGRLVLRVGEVKVYPDRGGHTDTAQLASARAQAGLYLHLLRAVVEENGWSDRLHVEHEGFLVLARAGSNAPRVRAREDLRWQARRAEVAIDQLLRAVAGGRLDDTVDPKRRLEVIGEADKHYCDGCLAFCDLADRCHDVALADGDPVVLGAEMARFLGPVPLPRAVELLRGDSPASAAETDLARRLAEGGVR